MKRLFLISFFLIFILSGCSNNNFSNNSNSDVSKVSTKINNITNNNITSAENNMEEEIANFTTKIYSKDKNRQNNISITCSKLNKTIVNPGEIFSFCNTVGKATTAEGYKKADIFDKNGNKIKGIGGGNCQISTTLYNAVLKLNKLDVIERHKHSNYVPYIQKGKDAAVAYGSIDFKFKNNYDYSIKIYAESSPSNVIIKINKI